MQMLDWRGVNLQTVEEYFITLSQNLSGIVLSYDRSATHFHEIVASIIELIL